MQLVDLSFEIEPTLSEPELAEIEYISHQQGAEILGKELALNHEDFPDHMGLSLERIKLTSHSGTHLDAPLHYGPFCEGNPSKNICDIPLEWCFQRGVVINCFRESQEPVSQEEIALDLEKKNFQLHPLDIVLIYTGADRLWGSRDYFTSFRGMSLEATKWLVEQGIKIIGIDSFGFDPPFCKMLENYQKTRNAHSLWPAHVWGRSKEYCQIEKLRNLNALLNIDLFKVCCFPIKIRNCGAGWVRAVAIIN